MAFHLTVTHIVNTVNTSGRGCVTMGEKGRGEYKDFRE